jgi:hypothetical protein
LKIYRVLSAALALATARKHQAGEQEDAMPPVTETLKRVDTEQELTAAQIRAALLNTYLMAQEHLFGRRTLTGADMQRLDAIEEMMLKPVPSSPSDFAPRGRVQAGSGDGRAAGERETGDNGAGGGLERHPARQTTLDRLDHSLNARPHRPGGGSDRQAD